ncbi:MAG TPA: pseudouridine synthase, partial [Polyangiaceae bacterium]|nr:pseudouridine synthase [Polyangiaceae bacterium]
SARLWRDGALVKPNHSFTVEQGAAGERLDKFLVQSSPELGRRGARWLTENGRVTVNGIPALKSYRLSVGERVDVWQEYGSAPEPEPELSLSIVLEREDLVIVDKPAGQPTAPLGDLERGSLAAALLARYPEMRGVGYRPREPGLLHRLDTRTSGLVVAARNEVAFAALRAALESHSLAKRYLAIVRVERELPRAGLIERSLGPDSSGSGRVRVLAPDAPGARPCSSRFATLDRRGAFALLEVVAPRAYRHQVRVHLASSGWPIAGDLEYGGMPEPLLPERHALHASQVAWAGDARVPAFAVESALPEDLRAFFDAAPAIAGADPSASKTS